MSPNPKEILFEEDALQKLFIGISLLYDTVCFTLGPKGRNVGIDAFATPKITSIGNQIIDEIEHKDPFINMGISFCKELTKKVKEKSGDGSTTAIILFHTLVEEGMKNIAAGHNPIFLRRGMEKVLSILLKSIQKHTKSISLKEIHTIATIGAKGDEEVGKYIQEAFEKVGIDGTILIEQDQGIDIILELVEGMELDRGYLSAHFCTDYTKHITELSDPYILITDKKISSLHDLLPLLQSLATTSKELLIIADEIEGDALATLVINKLKGILKIAAMKAPSFGDQRKDILEDIALLTGATVISEEKGLLLKNASIDMLGQAKKIILTKEKTTIISKREKNKNILDRIKQIDFKIQKATSSYEKTTLEKRKAKLKGGVAIIHVGAATELAAKQKKQLFEDSLSSTRAALEEGIVPGGGLMYLRAKEDIKLKELSKEEQIGAKIVAKACERPCRQILQNSGLEDALIIQDILNQKSHSYGYNIATDRIEDFFKAGIVDPAKVVTQTLISAISMAGIVLTSQVLISEAKEKK